MTLREQVGQLLWVGFDGVTVPTSLRARISRGEVGAAILFKCNIVTIEQLVALTTELRAVGPDVLLTVDQEGGRVQRVRAPATVWPPMIRVGEKAREVGRAIGTELAALGFDLNFAPILDVHTNPANPIIGDRAFGEAPETVIRFAGAFAEGLSESAILACGKHFPGHGDTALDSHLALPRVDHDLERLRRTELAPFFALRRLPVFMTAHVIFAALDDQRPATLSPRVLTDLLRGELAYEGIILSDDMEMKAITDHFGIEQAIEEGLLAGCDAFLLCHLEDLQLRAFETLVRAAERSSKVRDRVAESSARVASLKKRHFGVAKARPPLSSLGCEAHRNLALSLA